MSGYEIGNDNDAEVLAGRGCYHKICEGEIDRGPHLAKADTIRLAAYRCRNSPIPQR
jgi:hypothetical protein